MHKFKLQIVGTLGAIIVAIVVILASLDFHSFKMESVDLHKKLLRERNATIEARLVIKLKSYQQMLSSIAVHASDFTADGLSENLIIQLQALHRAQRTISDGVAVVNNNGDVYFETGKKLKFNVRQLNRQYYQALFKEGKNSLCLPLFNPRKVEILY
ncbi:hypothetical protein P4S72_21490 [Vibrio sp. PP-XX7]